MIIYNRANVVKRFAQFASARSFAARGERADAAFARADGELLVGGQHDDLDVAFGVGEHVQSLRSSSRSPRSRTTTPRYSMSSMTSLRIYELFSPMPPVKTMASTPPSAAANEPIYFLMRYAAASTASAAFLIAVGDRLFQHAHVGVELAYPQHPALFVEILHRVLGRHAQLLAQKLHRRRVDVPASRAHDEPFERGEAHGRVDALAVLHRRDAGTVAEMADDDAAVLRAEILHRLFAHELVASAVEAVFPDLILLIDGIRDAVHVRLGRHGAVEGGVEHRHHGHAGHDLAAALDAGDVAGHMQRAELRVLLADAHHFVVDDDGGMEVLAAVQHAVTDGAYLDLRTKSRPPLCPRGP